VGTLAGAGEQITVEVELHVKAVGRLVDKLRWCTEAGYAEVLWLVPSTAVEEPLRAAIAAVDAKAALMPVEGLPAEF
jgi:hypothetical protein